MPSRICATAIVMVGDELLSGHTLDTNSQHLAARAFAAGYPVRWIETVGDDIDQIAAAVRRAVNDTTVSRVAVCGGVGPTPDDRTLAGVAAGLDVALEENRDALEIIETRTRELFEAGYVPSPEVSPANRSMARVPEGTRVLKNPGGMAPPLVLQMSGEDRVMFVLPGVPRELINIVDNILMPNFFVDGDPPAVVELRYSGIPEAEFSAAMSQVGVEFPDVLIGSYPQSQRRELLLRFKGKDPSRVAEAAARLRELRPPLN